VCSEAQTWPIGVEVRCDCAVKRKLGAYSWTNGNAYLPHSSISALQGPTTTETIFEAQTTRIEHSIRGLFQNA
jgi:hypothetical protein